MDRSLFDRFRDVFKEKRKNLAPADEQETKRLQNLWWNLDFLRSGVRHEPSGNPFANGALNVLENMLRDISEERSRAAALRLLTQFRIENPAWTPGEGEPYSDPFSLFTHKHATLEDNDDHTAFLENYVRKGVEDSISWEHVARDLFDSLEKEADADTESKKRQLKFRVQSTLAVGLTGYTLYAVAACSGLPVPFKFPDELPATQPVQEPRSEPSPQALPHAYDLDAQKAPAPTPLIFKPDVKPKANPSDNADTDSANQTGG